MSTARDREVARGVDPAHDPAVLLLQAAPAEQVVAVRVSAQRAGLLREIADARGLVVDEHAGVDAGGLVRLEVKIGTQHAAIEQLARAVDLFAQVVGACVLGSTTSPTYLDVDRDGRNRLAGCVEETLERLERELGLPFRPVHV